MINTQASPQALPDPNVASLVPAQDGQSQQQPMNADDAKAALGNASFLQRFLLPQKKGDETVQDVSKPSEDDSAEGKTAPADAPEPKKEEADESEVETRLTKQIDELKGQIKDIRQQHEIDKISQEVGELKNE